MPLLEKATLDHEGKFKFIKLNIDTLPELATALNIKSIPTVFLVHKGNIIDTMTGVPNKDRFKEFIDTAVLFDDLHHDESVITTLLDKAQEFLE